MADNNQKPKRKVPDHIQIVQMRFEKKFIAALDDLMEKQTPEWASKPRSRHSWLYEAAVEKFERESEELKDK
jgi:hypothetical protein